MSQTVYNFADPEIVRKANHLGTALGYIDDSRFGTPTAHFVGLVFENEVWAKQIADQIWKKFEHQAGKDVHDELKIQFTDLVGGKYRVEICYVPKNSPRVTMGAVLEQTPPNPGPQYQRFKSEYRNGTPFLCGVVSASGEVFQDRLIVKDRIHFTEHKGESVGSEKLWSRIKSIFGSITGSSSP